MKKQFFCLLISLFLALLFIGLSPFPLLKSIEAKGYDLLMHLRHPIRESKQIVFIEMDEEAINTLGRWPWPRDIFANIVETLHSLGAKQILFDVTFTQPSPLEINKQALSNLFEGKKQLNQFISNVADEITNTENVHKNDIVSYFHQIDSGINDLATAMNVKINYALKNNDQLLAEAFKGKEVFIGYTFEILNNKKDILKNNAFQKLKNSLQIILQNHPLISYEDLPFSIKNTSIFSSSELKEIFLQAKIESLFRSNILLTVQDVAKQLNQKSNLFTVSYNSAKHHFFKNEIQNFLEKNPQSDFKKFIWSKEILDPHIIETYKNIWEEVQKEFLAKQKYKIPLPYSEDLYPAMNFYPPIKLFTESVRGAGFLNGIPDSDGVLREVPLFVKYKNEVFPHIAIASVASLLKINEFTIRNNQLILKKSSKNILTIPMDKKGTLLINWAGRWKDTFKHISCASIYRVHYLKQQLAQNKSLPEKDLAYLNQKEDSFKKQISNNICIIGLTAPGTHDYNPTPLEAAYPMVGTHGNIINSLLTKQFITRIPSTVNIALLILLAFLMGIIGSSLSPILGFSITMLLTTIVFSGSLFLFNKGFYLTCTTPLLFLIFSYIGITTYKFTTEEKEKRWIKNAFFRYVSKDILDAILKDPSKLELGGVRKVITVLFSDIRSFTTYSEKHTPEEVVHILNEYLDAMTQVIFKHKGTLDKYVGDEIMALYGAPKEETPEKSAKHALLTACEMLDRLKELHNKWEKDGMEPLDIGIGINTGDMVVGNMGSHLRMDYTVIGDAVNLGARVEALTRDFNCHIIITEFTFQYVKDLIEYEALEAIKVKGKNIPVMVYKVTGLKK